MKKVLVIHPVLMGMFPIIFLFSHNVKITLMSEMAVPLAATTLFVLMLWTVSYIAVRDLRRSGLVASLGILLFFSYGQVHDLTRAGDIYLLSLFGGLFLSGAYYIARNKRLDLRRLTVFVNVVSVFLVAVPSATAAYQMLTRDTYKLALPSASAAPDERPDIYYIILDGYARSDLLKEIYDWDNSDFLNYLEEEGFYIADKSRSNYALTCLSLASSLNFTYLDGIPDKFGEKSDNLMPLHDMIRCNRVAEFLKQYGYRFIVLSSGCSFTDVKDSDVYLAPVRSLSEFQNTLMNFTPLPALSGVFPKYSQFALHRNRILYSLETIGNLHEGDSPKFVFCHIVAPHFPFVFGANGEPIDPGGKLVLKSEHDSAAERGDYYINAYRAQIIFITKMAEKAVGEILANSKRAPIIIVQSDHGPDAMLDWYSMERTNLREKMSILNAYYLPGSGVEMPYRDITPVNTFRLIFNRYFGTHLDMLKDESYFSVSPYEYGFIDVTNKVSAVEPRR